MKTINKTENQTKYYSIVCTSPHEVRRGDGETCPAGEEFAYRVGYTNRLKMRCRLWEVSSKGWRPLRIEETSNHYKFSLLPSYLPCCHKKLARQWKVNCTGYKAMVTLYPELKDWEVNRKCDYCSTMGRTCK